MDGKNWRGRVRECVLSKIPMGLLFLEEREAYIMLYKKYIAKKKKKEMGGKQD